MTGFEPWTSGDLPSFPRQKARPKVVKLVNNVDFF